MESITNWCVYMHENRINGKKYIGITGQKPTRRWQNGKHYSGNAYFYAAIQKYGWDGFRHEILYTELTQEEAERLEVELIAKYSTQDPERGYNIASGGAARSGWHHSDEAKEKIGSRTRGKTMPAEQRQKIADAQRGEKNHAFGKHLTDEHKQKVAEALRGHATTDETRQKIKAIKTETTGRPVRCLETGQTYPSTANAAEALGASRSSVVMCCQGKRQTAGGVHWEYADKAVVEGD